MSMSLLQRARCDALRALREVPAQKNDTLQLLQQLLPLKTGHEAMVAVKALHVHNLSEEVVKLFSEIEQGKQIQVDVILRGAVIHALGGAQHSVARRRGAEQEHGGSSEVRKTTKRGGAISAML